MSIKHSTLIVRISPQNKPGKVQRLRNKIECKFTDELGSSGISCSFETVLNNETSQLNVFFSEINDAVDQSLLQNRSATLMAFGNSLDETFNANIENSHANNEHYGIILHAVSRICRLYEGAISVSCVDVYSDKVCDLFSPKQEGFVKKEEALRRAKTLSFVNSPESTNCLETNALPLILESLNNANGASSSIKRHNIVSLQLTDLPNKPRLVLIDLDGPESTQDPDKTVSGIDDSLETLALVLKSMSEPPSSKYIPFKESKITQILQKVLEPECNVCLIMNSLSQCHEAEVIDSPKPRKRVRRITIETPSEQKKRIVLEWINRVDQELEDLARNGFEDQGLDLEKVPFIEALGLGRIPMDLKLCELLQVDDEYTEEMAVLNSKIRDLESRRMQLSKYHEYMDRMNQLRIPDNSNCSNSPIDLLQQMKAQLFL